MLQVRVRPPLREPNQNNTNMSTKLNAEELAAKRYPEIEGASNIEAHFQDGCKAGYFFAIEEIAQPIADERDELRDALEKIANIEDKMYGGDWDEIEFAREIARSILAKHPKP